MSPKQKRFCEEYIIDLNATQAAIRAGYSKKTAKIQGSRLLTKVNIQAEVQRLRNEVSERNKISVDECVSLLTDMARFDIADCYDENGSLLPIHQIPKEARLAIESLDVEEYSNIGLSSEGAVATITKKIRTSSRRANIVELLKYLGGYEKDNEQKTPKPEREDLSRLSLEELKTLQALKMKAKG